MTIGSVTIRKFRASDALSAARIARAALWQVNAKHYSRKVILAVASNYSAQKIASNAASRAVLVAVLRNNVVGVVQLTRDGWVRGMFVDPERHGRGIGRALMRSLVKLARRRDFKAIRLHSALTSVGFYKKLGFRCVRRVVLSKDGETYRMIRRL